MLSIASIDSYQRRHGWIGFPLAVRQKYAEDRGGNLAAAISYYAFLSIFPLLVVLVSVLAYTLPGHPGFDHTIVASALGRFPVVGVQLRAHSLRGNALGIGLGIAGSLWAGSGIVLALQRAVDTLWGVPTKDQPGFVGSRLRAIALLAGLGLAVVATAALGGLGTVGAHLGIASTIGTILFGALVDSLLFWAGFRLLSGGRVAWRSLRGGAVAAGIGYEALQLVGGFYVRHVIERASATYGTFALVVGLLAWINLTAHITLLAIEGNVVATRRLWPRSLSRIRPPTDADVRALAQLAQDDLRRPDEQIEVSSPSAPGRSTQPGRAG